MPVLFFFFSSCPKVRYFSNRPRTTKIRWEHYLTQMLLAINWHYWQAGKIHACVWRFKIASCKRASLKSTRFSQNNKFGYFFNRPRIILWITMGIKTHYPPLVHKETSPLTLTLSKDDLALDPSNKYRYAFSLQLIFSLFQHDYINLLFQLHVFHSSPFIHSVTRVFIHPFTFRLA